MKIYTAEPKLTDEEAKALAGTLLDDSSYDLLLDHEGEVRRPDGSLLVKLAKKRLSTSSVQRAFNALREAATPTNNRGMAAGKMPDGKTRFVRERKDGKPSNTNLAKEVNSGVVGYFDRQQRFPYCRQTAFNMEKPEKFETALPMFQEVDRLFAAEVPDRYAAQKAFIERTHPAYVIHGTAFTTVTVNRNWQTAVHTDAGDLKEGFGVMSAIRAGEEFQGCYLCFPQYRVAVDMRTTDVCFADVHEWHGNTGIKGFPGRWTRLSMVFYYREKMQHCGSPDEELERAKVLETTRALASVEETINLN